MKFINSIQAHVGIEFSYDDAAPTPGVLVADLISFLGETYKFSVVPEPPKAQGPAVLFFQIGIASIGDRKLPINILNIGIQGGILIVTAKDTDTAEEIIADILMRLDKKFNYRIGPSVRAKYYQSNVAVEFTPALEKRFEWIGKVQETLMQEMPARAQSFAFKRIAFGNPEGTVVPADASVVGLSDFVIERRANEPVSANRFFCSAPVSTSEHVRILERFEQIAGQ
jgi:hypothetical protein